VRSAEKYLPKKSFVSLTTLIGTPLPRTHQITEGVSPCSRTMTQWAIGYRPLAFACRASFSFRTSTASRTDRRGGKLVFGLFKRQQQSRHDLCQQSVLVRISANSGANWRRLKSNPRNEPWQPSCHCPRRLHSVVLRQCRNSESICNRVWLRPQRLCVHNLATLVRDDDFSCIRCAPIFCQFLGYQSRVPRAVSSSASS
jgi:hypothetical protein